MEEDNAAVASRRAHVIGVKSWVAYLGLAALAAQEAVAMLNARHQELIRSNAVV